ncbi:MAG: hypothetical protein HYT70_03860 [Candidatus Aenigmarchaeota archaeon]|nr:hypothetical protein [Candidatus Aenigmarchaeota archaeon]
MKGQVGLEAIFIISFLTIFLIFSLVFNLSKGSEVDFTKTYLGVQKVCYEIKSNFNHVSSNGFGSAVKFTIPNKIESKEYNLIVDSDNKILTFDWENSSYSCTFFSIVTNGSYSKFNLTKGDKIFKNIFGVVVIANA